MPPGPVLGRGGRVGGWRRRTGRPSRLWSLCRRIPAGRLVLDAGAGTGAATGPLHVRGARVVALDASFDMLAWRSAHRPPAVVADVRELPLATASVDDCVAAFVLNHLPDPGRGFAELARVTRPGGAVLAAVLSAAQRSPLRDRVERGRDVAWLAGTPSGTSG